jgi:hypothetical protein
MTYSSDEVIARLVDQSLFWELWPDRGREMVVGVGRVNGLSRFDRHDRLTAHADHLGQCLLSQCHPFSMAPDLAVDSVDHVGPMAEMVEMTA